MWIAIILGTFLVLFGILVSLPLDIETHLETGEMFVSKASLRWAYGLITRRFERNPKGEPEPTEKPERKIAGKRKRGKPDFVLILRIIRTRGFLNNIRRLVLASLRRLKIKRFQADLRLGTGDPFDTAVLFGSIWSITAALDSSMARCFQLEPCFTEQTFSGELDVSIRLIPIRLAPPLFGFLFSGPTLRVFGILAADRWKRRR